MQTDDDTIEAKEARLRELEAAATPGPWQPESGDWCSHFAERDGALIAALRNDALAVIDHYRAQLAARDRYCADYVEALCPTRHWAGGRACHSCQREVKRLRDEADALERNE